MQVNRCFVAMMTHTLTHRLPLGTPALQQPLKSVNYRETWCDILHHARDNHIWAEDEQKLSPEPQEAVNTSWPPPEVASWV